MDAERSPISDGAAAEVAGSGTATSWRFDGFTYDRRRAELRGPDGEAIALKPRAEQLLQLFLAEPGRLFSKEDLLTALWPHTVVTDDSLVQVVSELRVVLTDRSQRLVRTLPRRGYRWDGRVEPMIDPTPAAPLTPTDNPGLRTGGVLAEVARAGASPPVPRQRATAQRSIGMWMVPLVAAVLTAATTATQEPPPIRIDAEIAARNTVAVIPFDLGTSLELRGQADAVADGITAQLSTRVGMRGIGRAVMIGQATEGVSAAQLARALHATYLLSGHVGRGGSPKQLSVALQLLALDTGAAVWARRFTLDEGPDLTHLHVGMSVVNAVRSLHGRPGKVGTLPASLPDPAELTLLAWHELDRSSSGADLRRARAMFQRAVRADATSTIALNGLAASLSMERADPRNPFTADEVREQQLVVERARQADPEDATAMLIWGSTRLIEGRPDLALPAIENANAIVPSYANGYVLLARTLLQLGRTAEVQAVAERAVALGEGDSLRVSHAYAVAAEAAVMLGDDERAYELAQRSVAARPSNMYAQATLAAAGALSGRLAESGRALSAFRTLWPAATVANYDDRRRSTEPRFVAQRVRLYEGLRRAGLPEG